MIMSLDERPRLSRRSTQRRSFDSPAQGDTMTLVYSSRCMHTWSILALSISLAEQMEPEEFRRAKYTTRSDTMAARGYDSTGFAESL